MPSFTVPASALIISLIILRIVVFPVPGPPVIITTLLEFTACIASFCLEDNFIFPTFSIFSNSSLKPDIFFIFFAESNTINLLAIFASASYNSLL